MSSTHRADRPFVSVIVPVYNDTERLDRCLAALHAQSWPKDALEVLVVDNNSQQDVSVVTRKWPLVRLLHEPVPGSYAARNTGVAAARGPLLAFTDADCLPAEDWLERAWEALRSARSDQGPMLVAVGGPVRLFARAEASPTWVETYELTTGFDQRRYIERQHYTVTANCVTTRDAFERTGPFDASLRSAGDKDWGQRAHKAGVKLVYAPSAIVRHPARHDLEELLGKRRRQTGGLWRSLQDKKPRWAATAQMLVQVTRPPLQRMSKAWLNSPTPTTLGKLQSAARVLAVSSILSAVCSVEVVRLHLGKAPER